MSEYRRQIQLDSPLEAVWDLVGTPTRYPEWWPRVIDVRGERFDPGDQFVQVTHDPVGPSESNFLIERRDDMREIRMSCQTTGTYAHWTLTPAQGGTFVELSMGMQPLGVGYRMFDATVGRRYFSKWSDQSIEGLRDAAGRTDVNAA